jgi:hypothetical protein
MMLQTMFDFAKDALQTGFRSNDLAAGAGTMVQCGFRRSYYLKL